MAALILASAGSTGAQTKGFVYSFELSGDIDSGAVHLLDVALAQAKRRRARLVIMRLDTRGGAGKSMRAMVKAITTSRIPVVVYVGPDGAQAVSAGMFVTVASDVAAMAPQTNIGSASPVFREDVPPAYYRKTLNFYVAYARALAERHGRNADLAERMVRRAVNVTATRARRERLVDVVADSEEALLKRLEGFHVKGRQARVLRTAGLRVERVDPLEDEGGAPPDEGKVLFGLGLPAVVAIGLLGLLVVILLGRMLWRVRPRFLR